MAFRGGGGGGRGRGRGKNRPTPYGIKDGRGGSWKDRGGNNKGEDEGPPQGEYLLPHPESTVDGGAAIGVSGTPVKSTSEEQLPPPGPKKFTNRARLFFGNLPRDFTEDELKEILSAHGEVYEIYHNKEKNFAFARMVSRPPVFQYLGPPGLS